MELTNSGAPGKSTPTLAALVSIGGLLMATAGCSTAGDTTATGVQILWLGSSGDRPTYGVTDAEVVTRQKAGDGFEVDMSAAGRSGAQWQTAAWTAATVGAMLAGVDPRGVMVSYRLGERIDGPSAGAVLTAAVLTDLRNAGPLSQSVTMTGTVLPSGALGPVGGIPAKLRAAAEAGIDTVLVPPGQSIAVDPATGRSVAVADLASDLGINVVAVNTVREALAYFDHAVGSRDASSSLALQGDGAAAMTPDPSLAPDSSQTLDPSLAALFTEQTNLAMQRLGATTIAAVPDANAPTADSTTSARPDSSVLSSPPLDTKALESERQRIASGVALTQARAVSLLAEGRVIDAFARATQAEREVRAWNAYANAAELATANVPAATEEVANSAVTLARQAEDQITATVDAASAWPLAYVEQVAALPDALSWATDAWAVAQVVESLSRIDVGPPASDVATASGLLAASRYDLEVYLPISTQLARQVGRTVIVDSAAVGGILATYAQLLGDTGRAGYADMTRSRAQTTATPTSAPQDPTTAALSDPLAWEAAILEALADRWQQQAPDIDASSAVAVVSSLSTAMSYYVAGATWSATSQLATGVMSQRSFGKSEWDRQVTAASAESQRTAALAVNAGANADYVRWNEAFGRGTATAASAIGATDAVRLNGLQVQWYGNVQGHMLVALVNGQPMRGP